MASAPNKDQEAGEAPPPPYQAQYGTGDNVPPSYTASSDPMEPPPSYDSIYGEIKAARAQSSGFLDFVKKAVIIILGTIGCTILVGIVLAIPISMIVIGSMYLHDCDAERYIPIYLIVAGVFGVIKNVSSIIHRLKNKSEEDDEANAKSNPFDGILSCFLFAWFIAGSVWIYTTWGDWSSDPDDDNYCHPTLMYFAFWMTTATYIVMAFSCLCCVCVGTVVALCSK